MYANYNKPIRFIYKIIPLMKSLAAINKYFWRYKSLLFWGVVTVIASNLFTIYPAQVIRISMNMVGDLVKMYGLLSGFHATAQFKSLITQSLGLFGVIMVGLALIRGVFLFFTRQTIIYMSRLIEYDMRNDIYDHFQNLSLAFYRRNRTGDLMSRIVEDVNRVRMYLGPGLMYTINTFTLFILVVATMVSINVKLTVFALLPLPILSVMIYVVQSIIQKRSKAIQEQLATLNTFTQEMFSGIRVVKAYVKEAQAERKFEQETQIYKERSMYAAKIDAIFYPLVMFLMGLSSVLTVWIGSEEVIAGNLTIGNIAEFMIYTSLLAWPIIALGWVTTLTQQAAASQTRINEFLKEEPEVRFTEGLANPLKLDTKVEMKEVSFNYPDTGIRALENVSFRLSAGQKLGIVGPAGCGKTTLCQLIMRMYDADAGEILIDGNKITALSKNQLRNKMGYAPQDVFLFSASIYENIAFGSINSNQTEVEAAAKVAAVHDNIITFPEAYQTVIGERGVNLSGGQKQRISIARAWMHKPELLILDDVLSAVDTHTEESILSELRRFRLENKQSSIIQVAHRLSCVQDSDLILVMENAKIIERGTHEELLAKGGYYSRIYQKQLAEMEEDSSLVSEDMDIV